MCCNLVLDATDFHCMNKNKENLKWSSNGITAVNPIWNLYFLLFLCLSVSIDMRFVTLTWLKKAWWRFSRAKQTFASSSHDTSTCGSSIIELDTTLKTCCCPASSEARRADPKTSAWWDSLGMHSDRFLWAALASSPIPQPWCIHLMRISPVNWESRRLFLGFIQMLGCDIWQSNHLRRWNEVCSSQDFPGFTLGCWVVLWLSFHKTNKKYRNTHFFYVSGNMVKPGVNYKDGVMAWG